MPLLLTSLLLGCLLISMMMSGMEAGVFALNRLRIRHLMRAGNRRARVLYGYLENQEDFLWTILVGNTLANFAIASIGVVYAYRALWRWPGLLIGLLCVAVLVFYALCELLPKMLFQLYPNRLCMAMALPFRAVHLVLQPAVALMTLFAGSLLRWTGGKPFTGHLFGSREELRRFVQESAHDFTTDERAMITRVLDLQKLRVGQLAVPMAQVVGVWTDTPIREVLARARERGVKRFPVWKKEPARQRVVGLVTLPSLLFRDDLQEHKTAGDYLQPALYLEADLRLELALGEMRRTGHRLAIVLGGDRVELGVLSLRDVLKVIFGEVTL
jgi:CBS domain containing-hemolysin-like protein